MKFKITNRQFLSAAIVIFYLIPFLFYSAFSIKVMPHFQSWKLFSLGLLLVIIGTFALTLLLFYWEKSIQGLKKNSSPCSSPQLPTDFPPVEKEAKVTSLDTGVSFEAVSQQNAHNFMDSKENLREFNLLETALRDNQEQQEQLSKTLEIKTQELEKLVEENRQLEIQAFQIAQDFADYKLFSEEQLKQKYLQMTTLQQITEDQRAEMEKRQEVIYQLDTKVHDLSYEIKTLLYLNEEEVISNKSPSFFKEQEASIFMKETFSDNKNEAFIALHQPNPQEISPTIELPIRAPAEAFALLKKCINMAQKLTGANYHSNEASRYREYSSSYYAIDQRRLFDNLRSEIRAMVIVYSQKEHKLLFVNNETKKLLGWSPEKFIEDFSLIMHGGINDWKKALSLLAGACDSQARLLAKSKDGHEIILNCHLGVIPTGLFRNYVIGILYPIDTYAQV